MTSPVCHHSFHHPVLGQVVLTGIADTALTRIELVEPAQEAQAIARILRDDSQAPVDPILEEVEVALSRYFMGEDVDFSHIPLQLEGTAFQKEVWAMLATIPFGETRSYGWIAQQLGLSTKASRAVGQANGKNPIPIIVPCHRVVQTNNKLGGYAYGQYIKQFLLHLENADIAWDVQFVQQKLDLFPSQTHQQSIMLL